MRPSRPWARCHPDMREAARGLCWRCYHRDLVSRQAGSPSIPKRHRRYQQMGLTRLGELPPPLTPAVEQHRVVIDPGQPLEGQLPPSCPKCHTAALDLREVRGLDGTGRELHCAPHVGGCGATYYLVIRQKA